MNTPDFYAGKAEAALDREARSNDGPAHRATVLARAQVFATLALAATSANAVPDRSPDA